MMKRMSVLCVAAAVLSLTAVTGGHAPSGAIFTTLVDGSEVNVNQFPSKQAVYLDGGPGIGAPATAAGLDDGTYVFQVTDPSGKALLSTDPANCRQFTVAGGVITGVVATGCQHNTGVDVDHNATTVQLFPFLDTPNNGGVYKAWVTRVEDFLLGCQELGNPGATGLGLVDCGPKTGGNAHGFIPSHSKTDNFKVKDVPIREIDAFFYDGVTGELLSNRFITWIDPVGVSNKKWSYWVSFWNITEAHVEAVEDGNHQIVISNQPGCTIGDVYWGDFDNPRVGGYLGLGEMTLTVTIKNPNKPTSVYYKIYCLP
jgi:hypothetical protein